MKLIKITKGGALHFRLSDGRLGACYESGYVRVQTKGKNIHWQIADQHVEGDSYNDLHDYVMAKAIEYMYLSQQRFPHKQNTISN